MRVLMLVVLALATNVTLAEDFAKLRKDHEIWLATEQSRGTDHVVATLQRRMSRMTETSRIASLEDKFRYSLDLRALIRRTAPSEFDQSYSDWCHWFSLRPAEQVNSREVQRIAVLHHGTFPSAYVSLQLRAAPKAFPDDLEVKSVLLACVVRSKLLPFKRCKEYDDMYAVLKNRATGLDALLVPGIIYYGAKTRMLSEAEIRRYLDAYKRVVTRKKFELIRDEALAIRRRAG